MVLLPKQMGWSWLLDLEDIFEGGILSLSVLPTAQAWLC